ncbi:dihydrofolate reductase family protein [Actinophytocola gossypii]|uniref:Dihydrofolate reductase family protein n=1 Tax=Actinophytocola gossypii TaxID=2812003 RepID=A0ABT2J915_9PSEU|nr:dihydrofolate reductase family protein [Actinophytocola gossypii]MCT2584201.1 dihydrofolate reductase family protein [Actinophytocola gossypii]
MRNENAKRTVVANVSVSLDGYVTGPDGPADMSWVARHAVSDQAREILTRIVNGGTTALLGRRNYEGFRGYWPAVGRDETADPRDRAYGQWLDTVEKVVFSTTLTDTDWTGARIVSGDPAEVVRELRAQDGGDIVVQNSLSLIRALLAADEVDRITMLLCPELSGGGVRLFEGTFPATSWSLTDVTSTDTGALFLVYDRPRR